MSCKSHHCSRAAEFSSAYIPFEQKNILKKGNERKINEGGFYFEQASVKNTAEQFTCC